MSKSLGCNNVNEGTERRHSEQKVNEINTKCLKGVYFLFVCAGLSGSRRGSALIIRRFFTARKVV